MPNDADGAVPWYQGIELFTGMRRLGKKVWMLNYNGEAHNLIERKNRKDLSIREQQFFDWILKDEKPAKWITEGVPAVRKAKTGDWKYLNNHPGNYLAACTVINLTRLLFAIGNKVSSTGNFNSVSIE